MTTRLPNLCDSCAHLSREFYSGALGGVCNAFSIIPVDIWFGGADHRMPHVGDDGVTYDLEPGREDLLQLWLDRRDREDDQELADALRLDRQRGDSP